MKKLVIVALALIAFQANAQDKKEKERGTQRLEKKLELEPQEMAQIQTKKMTLHLDLNEAQQKKVMSLNLENAKQRKVVMQKRLEAKKNSEIVKPTKEQKLVMVNKKLDAQIATKREMKTILNAEQYEKWVKTSEQRAKRKGKMKKRGKMKKAHKKSKEQKEFNKD